MYNAGVTGNVKGDPQRGITFVVYPKNGAITIPLPNDDMLKLDEAYLRTLTHNGTQPAAYPLQSFYAVCFGGAAEVPLSLQEMLDMEARRVGEYVINECM
jgi:hypothetical protein